MYKQNMLVGVRDVHLPSGWLLNAWRVPVHLVPRHGKEQRDKIRRCCSILPQDPAFSPHGGIGQRASLAYALLG
jgi:hypothetical protein